VSEFQHRINIVGRDSASKAFRDAGKASTTMGQKIANTAVTLASMAVVAKAVSAAFGKLKGAMVEPVKLAGIQEQAVTRLNAALRVSGQLTEANSKALQDNASALQKISRFGDEAIMPVQALLLQFGALGTEQVPRATKAVLDFAEANGQDIKGAAQLVAKAIGTSTNALSRYGIEIDNSLRGSERFAAIMEQIESKVGGTAEALGGTFLGNVDKVRNAWGDLLEKVGAFVTDSPAFQQLLEDIAALIGKWAGSLEDTKNNSDAFAEAQKVLLKVVAGVADAFVTLALAVTEASQAIINFGLSMGEMFGAELPPITKELREQASVVEDLKNQIGTLTNEMEGALEVERLYGENAADAEDNFVGLKMEIAKLEGELVKASRKYQEMSDKVLRSGVNFSAATKGIVEMRKELDELIERAEKMIGTPRSVEVLVTPGVQEEGGTGTPPEDGVDLWAEYWEAVREESEAHGAAIAGSMADTLTDALVDRSTTWKEQFEDFGTTVKATMVEAFVEPLTNAESGFASLFRELMSPMRIAGQMFNDFVITPMIAGVVKFLGFKEAAERISGAKSAGAQAILAAETAAMNNLAVGTMMPMLTAAATASAIATFGSSLAFGPMALAQIAGAVIEGQAIAATASVPVPKAEGGRITERGIFEVGERGEELILPETRTVRTRALLRDLYRRRPEFAPTQPSGGGGATINLTVSAVGLDEEALAGLLAERIDAAIGDSIA